MRGGSCYSNGGDSVVIAIQNDTVMRGGPAIAIEVDVVMLGGPAIAIEGGYCHDRGVLLLQWGGSCCDRGSCYHDRGAAVVIEELLSR